MRAYIHGAASRIGRPLVDGVEAAVQDVVQRALAAADLSIAEIDLVVTVASDTLDGMMVPLRAELAGAFGKAYLNVPSSAGHAVCAAIAAIEAEDAASVLVVGWGAASKWKSADSRANEFDPFHTRPLGAAPDVLAVLQRQILLASNALTASEAEAFRLRMASLHPEAESSGRLPYAFCDGAAALVLRAAPQRRGLVLSEYGTSSRSHAPLDGSMDPAIWVRESIAEFLGDKPHTPRSGRIETSGWTIYAEMRAIHALHDVGYVACDGTANRHGGGAMAWFGPATGLRALADLCGDLASDEKESAADSCLFADLAGPLGQHVTSLLIERRSFA